MKIMAKMSSHKFSVQDSATVGIKKIDDNVV